MATISKAVPFGFSLITGSVKVTSATQSKSKESSTIGVCDHETHDPTKTRQEIVCDGCGGIPMHATRAYATEGGYAILTADELDSVKASSVEAFKKISPEIYRAKDVELNSTAGERAYFIEPNTGSEAGYAVLAEMIANHPELAFVTKYAPRTQASVWRLISDDGVIVLQERVARSMEAVQAPDLSFTVDADMLSMAETILSTQKVLDFKPEVLRDEKEIALAKIAAHKKPVAIVGDKSTVNSGTQTENDLRAALEAEVKKQLAAQKRADARAKNKTTTTSKPRLLKVAS